jgi:hypothetical protein
MLLPRLLRPLRDLDHASFFWGVGGNIQFFLLADLKVFFLISGSCGNFF